MDGEEMIAVGTVSKITFLDPITNNSTTIFKNGFPQVGKNTSQTYYQLIDSGKAVLLKHIGIIANETHQYGDPVKKVYRQVKNFYVFVEGNMTHIKKPDDLIKAITNNKAALESFISSKNIKVNKEEDLKAVVSFYNKIM